MPRSFQQSVRTGQRCMNRRCQCQRGKTILVRRFGVLGVAWIRKRDVFDVLVVTSTQLTTNSIDCRIEPIRLYAHLNTILIQLKPLTLIDNRTPFHFHLYANAGHDHVYIHADELTCLSKLGYSQMQFVLIDPHDGEHIQCQPIDLVLRSIPMISSASMINNRLFSDGYVDLYFIKSSNNDYFLFRLRHEYLDHTHILTLQSKFFFNNQTDQSLMCSVLPISKQQYAIDHPYHCLQIPSQEKCPIYRFQGVPSTDISYYLLFQRPTQDKYAAVNVVSKPIQLLPIMDESVNRQCFCLFQKDHLPRAESTKWEIHLFFPRCSPIFLDQNLRTSMLPSRVCVVTCSLSISPFACPPVNWRSAFNRIHRGHSCNWWTRVHVRCCVVWKTFPPFHILFPRTPPRSSASIPRNSRQWTTRTVRIITIWRTWWTGHDSIWHSFQPRKATISFKPWRTISNIWPRKLSNGVDRWRSTRSWRMSSCPCPVLLSFVSKGWGTSTLFSSSRRVARCFNPFNAGFSRRESNIGDRARASSEVDEDNYHA